MSLISEVNGFLDNIKYEFPAREDSYFEIYIAMRENFSKLKDFRREMDFYGFQNPYFVVKGVRDSWKDPFFRQTATKKKITFDRIQYSIAAHRIALSHLFEASETTREKKRLTGEKALELRRTDDARLCENPDGVYNFETLPNFPYRGEYMLLLSNLPKRERLSYRRIVSALGQSKSRKSGAMTRGMPSRRDSYMPTMPMDADFKIKRTRGTQRRVATYEAHKSHSELIVDKYVRKCLGIGYASIGYNIFIRDLLKYYLKKSKFERERHTSIFPGIDPNPDKSMFGKFGRSIEKKEELESKLESLKIHEKSSLVGATAYYLVSEKMDETCEMFNISCDKINNVIEKFKKLGLLEGKPLITDRTKKFLEYLKAEK